MSWKPPEKVLVLIPPHAALRDRRQDEHGAAPSVHNPTKTVGFFALQDFHSVCVEMGGKVEEQRS